MKRIICTPAHFLILVMVIFMVASCATPQPMTATPCDITIPIDPKEANPKRIAGFSNDCVKITDASSTRFAKVGYKQTLPAGGIPTYQLYLKDAVFEALYNPPVPVRITFSFQFSPTDNPPPNYWGVLSGVLSPGNLGEWEIGESYIEYCAPTANCPADPQPLGTTLKDGPPTDLKSYSVSIDTHSMALGGQPKYIPYVQGTLTFVPVKQGDKLNNAYYSIMLCPPALC